MDILTSSVLIMLIICFIGMIWSNHALQHWFKKHIKDKRDTVAALNNYIDTYNSKRSCSDMVELRDKLVNELNEIHIKYGYKE